jgi:hypothetical protein
VAEPGGLAQVRPGQRGSVPQSPRHRPRSCGGLIGGAVEDGLPGGGRSFPGREPAVPVAGFPAADRCDLHGVVLAAVPGLGQVRAAARELPAGGLISAAASLERDV